MVCPDGLQSVFMVMFSLFISQGIDGESVEIATTISAGSAYVGRNGVQIQDLTSSMVMNFFPGLVPNPYILSPSYIATNYSQGVGIDSLKLSTLCESPPAPPKPPSLPQPQPADSNLSILVTGPFGGTGGGAWTDLPWYTGPILEIYFAVNGNQSGVTGMHLGATFQSATSGLSFAPRHGDSASKSWDYSR
jgi:hypothetical protein